jgi:hypothetical protein
MRSLSLHHEYLQRKKSDAKIILYKPKTFVLLKQTNLSNINWRILTVAWSKSEKGPDYFSIKYLELNHAGRFNEIFQRDCYWDQYENCIWDLVNTIKSSKFVAIQEEENYFAMWEIFLWSIDPWLAQYCDSKIFEMLAKSLNYKLNKQERCDACREVLLFISEKDITKLELWHNVFWKSVKDNDSEWLVKLINEQSL